MHGFEALVAEILEDEGYWVRRSFKVALTKQEKQAIKRPSAPRWEIDIIAYRAPENHVLAVECKSFLDSTGVNLSDLKGGRFARTYKLFTEPDLRKVVLNRLALQLVEQGLCARPPQVTLALAAGKIKGDPALVREFFEEQNWKLFDTAWIRKNLSRVSRAGYTDSVAAMVAKLLLRGAPLPEDDD